MRTPAGPGYVYCLIEHQSSPDDMMAFRLLRYSIAAMHRHLKQGHKRLPMIVPILFYHGKQSPYPYSMRWLDCFDDPAAAQTLYTQAFPLVDVTIIPDNEIKTHRKVALLEYVQKHIHERDINIHLNNITELMGKFKPSKEDVQSLMHYLTQEGNALDTGDFIRILGQNAPCYREEIMTIAEHLEQKGRQKGLQEGIQKGMQKGMQEGIQKGSSTREREIARNLLAMKMDRSTIEQVTGLSCAQLDVLMNAGVKADS
jgi:predicted transposase/invertase (TIGR01784 family)